MHIPVHFISRALAAALLCIGSFAAQAGDVGNFDTGWGSAAGKKRMFFDLGGTGPSKNRDAAVDSVVSASGAMFIAGTVHDADGRMRFGIAKLTAEGQPATAFTAGALEGRVTSIRSDLVATSIALSPNSLLVYVGGFSVKNPLDNDFVVCQFSATSGANHVFSALGGDKTCVDVAFPGNTMDRAYEIVVQPDGRILLAGHSGNSSLSDSRAAFVRLMPDGSRDTTFGRMQNDYLVTSRSPALYSLHRINAATVLPDGTVVAAGDTMNVGEEDWNGLVVTLKQDGSNAAEYSYDGENSNLRSTFFQDVIAFTEPGATMPAVIVSGKSEWAVGRFRGYAAKIFANGLRDTVNFGTAGQILLPPLDSDTEYSGVAQQQNGRLVVLGTDTTIPGDAMLFVRRFSRDGDIDTSFGASDEHTLIDFDSDGGNNLPAGISVRGNSAIYIGGRADQTLPDVDYFGAKLLLETTFADGFEN